MKAREKNVVTSENCILRKLPKEIEFCSRLAHISESGRKKHGGSEHVKI